METNKKSQDTNIQITWSNSNQEEIKDVTNSVSTDSANSVSTRHEVRK